MVRPSCRKTVVTPRRPFEKERLDQELKLVGEFGLKNKREVSRLLPHRVAPARAEMFRANTVLTHLVPLLYLCKVWRVKYTLAKIRKAARELLTLDEKDPKRLFEGNALLRRLVRYGILEEDRMKLDYVLGLRIEDFLVRVFGERLLPMQ